MAISSSPVVNISSDVFLLDRVGLLIPIEDGSPGFYQSFSVPRVPIDKKLPSVPTLISQEDFLSSSLSWNNFTINKTRVKRIDAALPLVLIDGLSGAYSELQWNDFVVGKIPFKRKDTILSSILFEDISEKEYSIPIGWKNGLFLDYSMDNISLELNFYEFLINKKPFKRKDIILSSVLFEEFGEENYVVPITWRDDFFIDYSIEDSSNTDVFYSHVSGFKNPFWYIFGEDVDFAPREDFVKLKPKVFSPPRVLTDLIAPMEFLILNVLDYQRLESSFLYSDASPYIHVGTRLNKVLYPKAVITSIGRPRRSRC